MPIEILQFLFVSYMIYKKYIIKSFRIKVYFNKKKRPISSFSHVHLFLDKTNLMLTSPRFESPHCPLVSGSAITRLIPGNSLPDSMRGREWGAPRSTRVTRSWRKARRSTYTVDGSGELAPWKILNIYYEYELVDFCPF